jgi:hypothetical protein
MAGRPDPKPERRAREPIRIVDPAAIRLARLLSDECAACHRPPANAHHVIERGAPHFGDDVPANIVLLCGTGTGGCHGAYHGAPYEARIITQFGVGVERRDREWVASRIGKTIMAGRPDTIAYVIGKLGGIQGYDYLHRRYGIVTTLEGDPCTS